MQGIVIGGTLVDHFIQTPIYWSILTLATYAVLDYDCFIRVYQSVVSRVQNSYGLLVVCIMKF